MLQYPAQGLHGCINVVDKAKDLTKHTTVKVVPRNVTRASQLRNDDCRRVPLRTAGYPFSRCVHRQTGTCNYHSRFQQMTMNIAWKDLA
jgi:hypothetical protein